VLSLRQARSDDRAGDTFYSQSPEPMHRVMPDKTSTPVEALHSLRTNSSGHLRASNPFSFVEKLIARQAQLACSTGVIQSHGYIKLLDRDQGRIKASSPE
jgi:hypothetical protein